jgi:hypothetical protein
MRRSASRACGRPEFASRSWRPSGSRRSPTLHVTEGARALLVRPRDLGVRQVPLAYTRSHCAAEVGGTMRRSPMRSLFTTILPICCSSSTVQFSMD